MKSIILICAFCLQLEWSYGRPEGVGAYAYQDSAGNRYGGTYGLKDQDFNFKNTGDATTTFGPNQFQGFPDLDSFFPEYFRNLENLLQEEFAKNAEQQRKAMNAAMKAFDLTSNQAGYVPNFDTNFNRFSDPTYFGFPDFSSSSFGGFSQPFFGPMMMPFGANSAYAGGAVGPGFRHQMIALNPTKPGMPNIDVTQYSDSERKGPGFYSVQSSSYASSSNVDGQRQGSRGGETIVNDNGKITKYSLK